MEIKTTQEIYRESKNLTVFHDEIHKKWVAVDDVVKELKNKNKTAMNTVLDLLLKLDN